MLVDPQRPHLKMLKAYGTMKVSIWGAMLFLLNSIISLGGARKLHCYSLTRFIVVDQHGAGDFMTVQDAVDAVHMNNTDPVTIFVQPGIYREKLSIPLSKPFITLQGAGYGLTTISWDDFAEKETPEGRIGAFHSATVIVAADNFIARSITFRNSKEAPAQGPAVALRISGDKAAFFSCNFLSGQGTLYDHKGRHYFKECYIEGFTDVIFGAGTSIYKNCEVNVKQPGSLTAQTKVLSSTTATFAFVDSKIMGAVTVYLKNMRASFPRLVFLSCYIEDSLYPLELALSPSNFVADGSMFYGEFNCTGPGARNDSIPFQWSYNLTQEEAQPFLDISFIAGAEWVQHL